MFSDIQQLYKKFRKFRNASYFAYVTKKFLKWYHYIALYINKNAAVKDEKNTNLWESMMILVFDVYFCSHKNMDGSSAPNLK